MSIIYKIFALIAASIMYIGFFNLGRWALDKLGFKDKLYGPFSFFQIADFTSLLAFILVIALIALIKNY